MWGKKRRGDCLAPGWGLCSPHRGARLFVLGGVKLMHIYIFHTSKVHKKTVNTLLMLNDMFVYKMVIQGFG